MKRATIALLLALTAWAAASLLAFLSHRTINLMEEFGILSVYHDSSAFTAINWLDENKNGFTCLFLKTGSEHRCGLNVQVGDGTVRGGDFRGFSTLRLAIQYRGAGELLRVSYRHALANAQANLAKFHEFHIPIREGIYIYEMPFDGFVVPEWWISRHPMEAAATYASERSNVVHIGFDLENPSSLGQHHFNVVEFSAVSRWLNVTNAGMWAVASLGYLLLVGFVYNFFRLRSKLQASSEEMFGLLRKLEKADTESAHFKKLSMYDSLTGLLNRRAALDLIDNYSHRNSLAGTALLVMDIDLFKEVNDRYGHDLGDEVLKKLAGVIRASLREGDAAVRWGGEEVVIICPKTMQFSAVRVAEKLREEIKKLRFSEASLTITASFGVAEIMRGESFDYAFRRADQALYEAKSSGRDCVRCAQVDAG